MVCVVGLRSIIKECIDHGGRQRSISEPGHLRGGGDNGGCAGGGGVCGFSGVNEGDEEGDGEE